MGQLEDWQEESFDKQGIALVLVKNLVGKTLEYARLALPKNIPSRITSFDKKACMITHDLIPYRLNFEVENNIR
jgi:hypothetical protein